MILIVGRTCSGKNTYANMLETAYANRGIKLKKIISHTTRPKRKGEVNGVDYFFCTTGSDEYKRCRKLCGTTINNYQYFITEDDLSSADEHTYFIVDPNGVKDILLYFNTHFKNGGDVDIRYISADYPTRYQRAKKRGDDLGKFERRDNAESDMFNAFEDFDLPYLQQEMQREKGMFRISNIEVIHNQFELEDFTSQICYR